MIPFRKGVAIAIGVGLVAAVLGSTAEVATADSPSPTASATATESATPSASATDTPTASVSPTPSASDSTSPTPTPTPRVDPPASVASYLSTAIRIDRKSTISVNVATGSVSVRFRSKVKRKRPVSLQRLVDGAWEQVAKRKMNSKGRVTFTAGTYQPDSVYRAVALRYKVGKERAPLRATRTQGWALAFSDEFTGSALDDQQWSSRVSANQGPRYCSRTIPEMYSVAGGALEQSVGYMQDEDLARQYHLNTLKVRSPQGCWWGWENSPTGYGVYDTAMITTEGKYVVNTGTSGTVAARVRFPEAQGMHGAIWLQNPEKAEIDMVEGFGYGRGISNYIHTASKQTLDVAGPAKYKLGAYVMSNKTKKRSWWQRYHTYSISWTSKSFTFRVDGTVTKTIKIRPGDVDYSLVVSLLVSDWEANRITHPIKTKGFEDVEPAALPVQMSVDWVRVWQKA